MKTAIVKIDPKEYGLEESKAEQISNQFKPMLDKMVELEKEFNDVILLPIEEKETSVKAGELRKKYVKVRTGTAEIHKQQKAFYLAGGRFVDGWKNAQLFASQGIEEKLEAIEKHFENKERQRMEDLKNERIKLLEPYNVENVEVLGLGIMNEEVWNNFLTGTKANHEAKILAEQKAEEERIAKENAEAEERERIRLENIELKKKQEEQEKQLAEERAKAEAEKKKAEQEAKRIADETAKREAEVKAKADAEQKRMQEEAQKKIAEERKERERVEAELKAKQDEEARIKHEAEEKEQAELAKGDADKINDLKADLEILKTKYVFKSSKSAKTYAEVGMLLDKVIAHLNK